MAQKLLTPFKKLPQQIQNLPIFQKLQDFTTGKHTDVLGCHHASTYGIMEHPVGIAYDKELGLIAVAYRHGHLQFYGAPGLSFPVDCCVEGVQFIEFLPNEGRLLVATSSSLVIVELNAISGHWEKKASVEMPFSAEEKVTALAVGRGVVYVGSSAGTLRQVGIYAGKMTVGDDDLTSLPAHVILNKLPEDKREQMHLESAIVSIELHSSGEELLLGYAGGTAIVAQPQVVPDPANASPATAGDANADVAAALTDAPAGDVPTTNGEIEEATPAEAPQPAVPTTTEEQAPAEAIEETPATPSAPQQKKSKTGERHVAANLQAIRAEATKKFRTLSKTIKNKIEKTDHSKSVEVQVSLPVPPSPRVLRLLPYTQALSCATWRVTSADLEIAATQMELEVLVAYDDGAHLTWKVPKTVSGEGEEEPIIAVNQEVASIPYGPLPCGAIQRILARPSAMHAGAVVTIFVGGLPRAQHSDKHTVSVLVGPEEHVCFQFGSAVRDFVILPRKGSAPACCSAIPQKADEQSPEGATETPHLDTKPAQPTEAGYLLVLTDGELVAIDLTQPNWPVLPSPYLKHLDCTTVTAMAHVSVSSDLLARIQSACDIESSWPVRGGSLDGQSILQSPLNGHQQDIIAVGHAYSSVSLWHLGRGDCFRCLGQIHCLAMMDTSAIHVHPDKKADEEAWPPFRHVGHYEAATGSCPSELDPRCAVRSLSMQLVEGGDHLAVFIGGSAGNLTMWSTDSDFAIALEPDVAKICVDLIEEDDERFVWEGPPALKPMEGTFKPCPSANAAFGLAELVQFNPPSAITAVAYEPKWAALAVGSAHGFALIDLKSRVVVYKKLITPAAAAHLHTGTSSSAAGAAASKIAASGRQLKNTLRESFRKLRKIRSQPSTDAAAAAKTEAEAAAPAAATEETPAVAAAADQGEMERTASDVVGEAITAAATTDPAVEEPEKSTTAAAATEEEEVKEEAEPAKKKVSIEDPNGALTALKPTDAPSGVSALLMADTYIVAGQSAAPKEGRLAFAAPRTASLIVGTRAGWLLAHTLEWQAAEDLRSSAIEVKLVKEVQLKHGAPLLGLQVFDANAATPITGTEKTRCVTEVVPVPIYAAPTPPQPSSGTAPKAEPEELPAEEAPSQQQSEQQEPSKKALEEGGAVDEATTVKAAAAAPVDCHELLICTEEQVRIMAMPCLSRIKHKYRVFFPEPAVSGGGGVRLGGSKSSSKASAPVPAQETKPATEQLEPVVETEVGVEAKESEPTVLEGVEAEGQPDAAEETPLGQEAEKPSSSSSPAPAPASSLRRVATFGLCQLPGGDGWHVVLGLKNGRINILSLPTLRRVLKASCCPHATECVAKLNSSVPCATAGDSANLVFFPVSPGVLIALEISVLPPSRLASPVVNTGLKGETYCLCLPEWARPRLPPLAATTAASATVATASTGDAPEDSAAKDAAESAAASKSPISSLETNGLSAANETAKEVRDLTEDILSKGVNADGIVSVTTTESSLEKHTVIEGGSVVTTVHEVERVDGEVTKDDTVQVKSTVGGGDVELQKPANPLPTTDAMEGTA